MREAATKLPIKSEKSSIPSQSGNWPIQSSPQATKAFAETVQDWR